MGLVMIDYNMLRSKHLDSILLFFFYNSKFDAKCFSLVQVLELKTEFQKRNHN